MKSVLLLGNPYILDSIIPVLRYIKCFDEYDSYVVSVLAEQINIQYENICVYNDVETALQYVSEVVVLDDGYYDESRVQELKLFFTMKSKQVSIIKITSAPTAKMCSDHLIIKTLKSKNSKPTVLILNLAEPSQIIKAHVLLCNALHNRNIKLLSITDYNQGLFHKSISHINICPHSNNTNCFLSLYHGLDNLYTTSDYQNAEMIVVSILSEVALLDVDSSYLLEKTIQNLSPDYTICCVPSNCDISKVCKILSAKYALDIDFVFTSNYALHPDYKKRYFRCTNEHINFIINKKNVSNVCDEVIVKLSRKQPVQLK